MSTLYALAAELDVSLDELLFDERRPADTGVAPIRRGPAAGARIMQPAPPVQRAATATRSAASGVVWDRLTTTSEPGIEFLHVTYEVGGASGANDVFQRHPGHEWGYVLSGTLEVRIGFDEYVLGPGDAISINSSVPHRLANIGDVPVDGDLVRAGPGPVRRPDVDRRAPAAIRHGGAPLGSTFAPCA